MTFFEMLETKIGLPVEYGSKRKQTAPPYLVYRGGGQDQFNADDTVYFRRNTYVIEYYFAKKSEATEKAIEDALLENGYQFDKSEDITIDSEGIYMIYYYV